ncbi:uncharacterized protein LOC116429085 isoform X2 [Nomia melanderi]|uniref:uncharacterized protein LOC116429085 isoform X2 n=1 Tax=Nomia melanderi TaxID=2448451 RepID=UPI001303FB2F|nr:SEC23-interacting protein-like isoform X2 [Nomia melanderi]
MSGASRQVKNPLLSAAGEGFPFENYAENALLVPVTPATPAVLRDDAELENLVGQGSVNSQNLTSPAAPVVTDSEFTPIPLHSETTKAPENQPARQGYFTSILSSLPNLSLSSITGETSNQGQENVASLQNRNPHLPPPDRRDSLKHTPPPPVSNFQDSRRTNFAKSGEVYSGNSPNLSAPPQPAAAPPTIPSSGDGPISYRLGNQRRLKYAPPPELTSNTSKQYSTPPIQPEFTPQNVVSLNIFNPNESVAPAQTYQPAVTLASTTPSLEHSTPEQLSQANSRQESFRSSPVASGVSHSSTGTPRSATPQSPSSGYENVPLTGRTAIPQSLSRPIPVQVPETATPQNTPVNFSFPGFDLYANQRDFLSSINSEKEAIVARNVSSQVEAQALQSNVSASAIEVKPTVTFAPTSAVQISEKLEHLLAERKEDPLDSPADVPIKTDENILDGQAVETSDEAALGDIKENSELLKLDSSADSFVAQESSVLTAVPSKAEHTAAEKIDVTQSHAVSSNVSSFQHFQTQPFSPSSGFLEDQTVQQKSNLNYIPVENTSSSAFVKQPQQSIQPASSFFDSTGNVSHFSLSQYKEPSTDVDLTETTSENDSQQPPLNAYFSSQYNSPSTFWDNSVSNTVVANTTCDTVAQSVPPPQLYNPLEFQTELQKPPPAKHHPYVSSFVQPPKPPLNQAQHYFEDLSGSTTTYATAVGNNNIFLPSPPALTNVPEPTGSATLSPVQMSINPLGGRSTTDSVFANSQNLTAGPPDKRMQYRTVYHHWFYRKEVEHKVLWLPFSMQDSLRLEEVHNSTEITPETTVATDGGRYDVDILRRRRSPVYWSGVSTEVRRCSWFFKGVAESKYIPYDESVAAKLEEEYKQACMTNNWNRRVDLNNGEYVIFHGATVQVHYTSPVSPEVTASWSNSAGAASRPRVVKRGLDEFHIDDGEPETVDHLLFLVHGIGSVCDLKFRSVEEVVDEFRSISLQLVQSHYRTASEQRIVNRIEVLPISWHTTLHSEDTGIDKKLQAITLDSIPKLRHFTNDTLLDILFYTSPVYCQTIMQTVGSEMNRLYTLFKERNPDFEGGIYLGGHSLGSLILFDLLCHQKPASDKKPNADDTETTEEKKEEENNALQTSSGPALKRRLSKKISYVIGAAGTGQPYIHYPQLNFHPRAFFALGSPIGMFVTVRGIDMLGEDFELPTCPAFFNIFHPFDPVAYRVEALINLEAHKYRPMLIPHHKGRKRMHLELKETMARVGADLKQRLLDSVRNTWNSVYQLTVFHKPDNGTLEQEINKVVEEELQKTPTVPEQQTTDDGGADFKVGKLNGGRRIDYVLQEAPFEYINEYIFALTSHVCYWESEDTMLLMLKEIYGSMGIQTDAQLPQQTLSIERTTPSPSLVSSPSTSSKCDITSPIPGTAIDPTAPISDKSIGPPPMSGFVRKS